MALTECLAQKRIHRQHSDAVLGLSCHGDVKRPTVGHSTHERTGNKPVNPLAEPRVQDQGRGAPGEALDSDDKEKAKDERNSDSRTHSRCRRPTTAFMKLKRQPNYHVDI